MTWGRLEIVKYLVESGTDINAVDKFGKTPLNYAVNSRSLGVISYLVENGANLEIEWNDNFVEKEIIFCYMIFNFKDIYSLQMSSNELIKNKKLVIE